MIPRFYHAPVLFAFLSAALIAGCNGGAAVPSAPTGLAPVNGSRPNASVVRIWVAPKPNLPNSVSAVYGLSAGGKSILKTIHTAKQTVPGYYPTALKVDHNQNLWVLNQSSTKSQSGPAVIQEYTSSGTFTAAYVASCLGCSTPPSITDVAINASYVSAIGSITLSGYTSYGLEMWPNGDPSASPNWYPIRDPGGCSYYFGPCAIYYGDVDNSSPYPNFWFVGKGCEGPSTCGLGLYELVTSGDYFNDVELPGTYAAAGFVHLNGTATTLSVEVPFGSSSYGPQIYQYALPFSPGEAPFNTLTPCLYNCYPGDFGFNKTGKQIAIGDGNTGNGWVDLGITAKNKWKEVPYPGIGWLGAAAYTPSDK